MTDTKRIAELEQQVKELRQIVSDLQARLVDNAMSPAANWRRSLRQPTVK